MIVNTIRQQAAQSRLASVALALAVVGSACGATTAHQSQGGPSDVARDSAGSSSIDYDTAQHMGRLEVGAGSFSLDYNTAEHMGRLNGGAGSSSLDYDTARHMGRLGASIMAP